ncbi:MAG: PD40 domain-containing protein [Vicingus serpentipes]|nr:PD40 domain-containing protein [Vicingus serpentipes]
MVLFRYFSTFVLTIFFTGFVFSQEKLSAKDEKQMLEKAEFYYEDESSRNILKALKLFEKLSENNPDDPYYKLMIGICDTYFQNKKNEAINKLLDVKESNPDFNEVNFYLGRAYAVNHQFDEGIEYYQEYLSEEGLTDEQKSITRQNIIYCQNAKQYIKDSLAVNIRNIGTPINTEYSEYVPVITPDESMLIYTYRGKRSKGGLLDAAGKPDSDGHYYEDIMISYKLGDDWLEPESIDDNINTVGHDASIALSVDGQQLFIYKQDKKNNGDIYISNLNGENWTKPEPLQGGVNTEAWEGSASLSSNGETLYFASDRAGGFGGRDLYSAILQPDNSWGDIKNLGPTINTKFDDDAPFIHPDRKTMYFSSKGHNSMGGYDIFYTYLSDEGWDEPKNIGYPINTIDDDRYYVLSADAKTGYYSSAGRSEKGTHDIYMVGPGHFGKRPVLALVIGVVKADDKPLDADITVTNNETGEVEGKFKSNSTSGKYMLALTPGNKYKIAIEVEGYQTRIDYLDVESLESYVQVEHDFNLHSKENIVGEEPLGEIDPLQGKIDKQIEQYRYENTKKGYEEKVYNEILKEEGGKEEEAIGYFVELNTENVKEIDITDQPHQTRTYPDGTKKEVLGPFKTLLAAEVARQQIIKKDPALAASEVKVDNKGKEETIKEYYAERYTKKDFDGDTDIHEHLTKDKSKEESLKTKLIDESGDDALTDAKDKLITGLKFKVEIGAVEEGEEFKLGYLEKYGKITAKTYPDGKTRYTFGPFETLVEAENFRKNLLEKEKASEDAFVTVFVFGQRKTITEYEKGPCENDGFVDFSWFIGKDLNDKKVYNQLIKIGGNSCAEGLEFKVQIAAYRHPENYVWNHLKEYGEPLVLNYPDEITRFTQGSYHTLAEAEVLRQKIIKSGQKDAWITPFYKGKRMLLEDLFKVNFYGKSIN